MLFLTVLDDFKLGAGCAFLPWFNVLGSFYDVEGLHGPVLGMLLGNVQAKVRLVHDIIGKMVRKD